MASLIQTVGNLLAFLKWHFFPYKTTFTLDQIPNLSGRIVIVTGGNVGIGKETIRFLLNHNAVV